MLHLRVYGRADSLVAFAAGVAGILSLETRASSTVGVAISITTIPAAAYLGVAAGVREVSKALGALAVLGVNIAVLVLAGALTLTLQRLLAARRVPQRSAPVTLLRRCACRAATPALQDLPRGMLVAAAVLIGLACFFGLAGLATVAAG